MAARVQWVVDGRLHDYPASLEVAHHVNVLRDEIAARGDQIADLQRLLREAMPSIRLAQRMDGFVCGAPELPDDWHKRYEEVMP